MLSDEDVRTYNSSGLVVETFALIIFLQHPSINELFLQVLVDNLEMTLERGVVKKRVFSGQPHVHQSTRMLDDGFGDW